MPVMLSRPEWLLPLFPLVVWFAPVGLWIPLALTGLWCLILHRRQIMQWGLRANPAVAALAGLAIISGLWALQPGHSASRGVVLALEALAGLAVFHHLQRTGADRLRRPLLTLLALTIALSAFALIDTRLNGALSLWAREPGAQVGSGVPYSRGAAFQAMTVLPLTVLLTRLSPDRRQRWLVLALAGIGGLQVLLHTSETAVGALLLAAVAAGAVLALPHLVRLLPVALIFAVLAMPWIAPRASGPLYCLTTAAPSLAHRLHIWTFVAERISDRPWFGWGLEADRVMPGGREHATIARCDSGAVLAQGEKLPLHPHNGPLQVWLNLGLAGALLMAVLLGRALVPLVARVEIDRRAAALLTLTTVPPFIIVCLGYGLWQSWLLSSLWLTAALIGRQAQASLSYSQEGPRK